MIHYTSEQLSGFPWIASADTLKTEDLLPKFWSVAEDLAVRSNRLIPADLLQTLTRLAGEDSDYEAWSEDAASAALSELFYVLNDAAPCGFGFGASDGDGACFGFWLDQEWADLLEHCGWAADSDPEAVAGVIRELELDGIDTENYQDAYCGQADGYSEERAGADYAQYLFEDSGLQNASLSGWPFHCIDWDAAWRDLEMGDGYRLHHISGTDWAVFRAV